MKLRETFRPDRPMPTGFGGGGGGGGGGGAAVAVVVVAAGRRLQIGRD